MAREQYGHLVIATLQDFTVRRERFERGWEDAVAMWRALDDARLAGLTPHVRFYEVREATPELRRPQSSVSAFRTLYGRGHKDAATAAAKVWRAEVNGRTGGGWYYDETGRPVAQGQRALVPYAKKRDLIYEHEGRWYRTVAVEPAKAVPLTEKTPQQIAEEIGSDHGKSAASWYFDGNTPQETYEKVVAGLDDGDPMILDSFPSSPLSGEWSDSHYSRADLASDTGVFEEGSDGFDDVCSAYEAAFDAAVLAEIERAARYQLSKAVA